MIYKRDFNFKKGVERMAEHEMYVRSHNEDEIRNGIDADSLGKLVLVNKYTDKEYDFEIWGREVSNFDNNLDRIKDEGLNTLIWLSGVVEELDLKNSLEVEDKMSDALFQSQLADLINGNSLEKVEQSLIAYNTTGKEFVHKIPFEHQNFDIKTLLIDEEISHMTEAAMKGELTHEAVFNFGTLIEHSGTTEIHVGKLDYLKEPFEKAVEYSNVSECDVSSLKHAFKALQLESPELFKELDYEADMDYIKESGDVVLIYDIKGDNKVIDMTLPSKEKHYTPSYDLNGEEKPSPYYDEISVDETIYYLDEKKLTFTHALTREEYPLEQVLTERQMNKVKNAIETNQSIQFPLNSENVDKIKGLEKEPEKSLSNDKSQGASIGNRRNEIEHAR